MPNPNLPINFRKNTYIGARYVPKFSDTPGSEWDNSIQYEPLTIVLYQGNSYTSKTFVPVGVDISNEMYWAQTGNYDAQVESYKNEVEKLINMIDFGMHMCFVHNTNNSQALNGNAIIVKGKNKNFMVDIGADININNVVSSLITNKINKLDAIIISHWHLDHCNPTSLNRLVSLGYITSDTAFYLPKKSNNSTIWTSVLADNYNNCIGIINNIGAKIVFPSNGDIVSFDVLKVTFANCSVSDIDYYDSNTNDYNNFSMVTYIECFNGRVGLFGDIHKIAQARIYDNGNAYKCTAISGSHHGNASFDNDFLLTVFPDYSILCSSAIYVNLYAITTVNENSFLSSYGCKIYDTSIADVYLSLSQYELNVISAGYSLQNSVFSNITLNVGESGVIENGSSLYPFSKINKAIAFANRFEQSSVIINAHNSEYLDFLNITNKGKLVITDCNLGSVRVQNVDIEFRNVSFNSSSSYSLYANLSRVILSNCSMTGDTTNLSVNVGSALVALMSDINGTASFNDKICCIKTTNNSTINLEQVTVENVKYIGSNTDMGSKIIVNQLTGAPSTRFITVDTVNAFGRILVANRITLEQPANVFLTKINNLVQINIYGNLELTSVETELGHLPSMYFPLTLKYIPISLSNGTSLTGDQITGTLSISPDGKVSIITNKYTEVKYIYTCVNYITS